MIESEREKTIEKWVTGTFKVLKENDIILNEQNFFILRNNQDQQFKEWIVGTLS